MSVFALLASALISLRVSISSSLFMVAVSVPSLMILSSVVIIITSFLPVGCCLCLDFPSVVVYDVMQEGLCFFFNRPLL